MLVPSVGVFFTPLNLHDAFLYQDSKRFISWRRFVAPSFNDIRLILNTAQVMSLVAMGPLELVTFDGDVTLYDDGGSLDLESPVLPRLLDLLRRGTKIGIVTAAGYTEGVRYYERLRGLLDAVHASTALTPVQKQSLVVMGGESSYLFQYSPDSAYRLKLIPRDHWLLDEMKMWQEEDIKTLLDLAELALKDSLRNLRLDGTVLRKERYRPSPSFFWGPLTVLLRAVGIIPKPGHRFPREALEETVLVAQKILELSAVGRRLPFCAFNGGNDVFVDIGDKSWGVRACQGFFNGIEGGKTLHVGDQFLSAGANDFKARLACTTAWIANPAETVSLLDEIAESWDVVDRKKK
jgi:IMP and pyridine-specific 5'-nucleotidase